MDTPLEEWEEVKQKEQEIQDTVGKILLEGREVKWGKTTPFDHQAGIFDLHLGKALPIPETSDRVMAFNPLTATLQHTFCVDESQLKTQGDERRPWIRSLVMTEEGLIVMADFMNKKTVALTPCSEWIWPQAK
nr:hypothetical protein BaRGS_031493 [Batillaria attramentaria]